MNSFLYKVFIFCLPIFTVIGITEILLQHADNNYSYKNKYLKEHKLEIETLIMGSSYSYYGINPTYIDGHAFNLANPSQSIYLHRNILEEKIDDLPNLETVVINIAYASLSKKREQETWRKYYYLHYMDVDLDIISKRSIGYYSIFGGIGLKASLENIWRSYLKNEKREKGWQPLEPLQHKWGKKSAIKQENNSSDFTENILHLNSIIEMCKDKNINVVLLTLPVSKHYSNHINKKKLQSVFDACENLSQKNTNTFYLNHLYHPSFIEEDYFDEHHLSRLGAVKISVILNDDLNNLISK